MSDSEARWWQIRLSMIVICQGRRLIYLVSSYTIILCRLSLVDYSLELWGTWVPGSCKLVAYFIRNHVALAALAQAIKGSCRQHVLTRFFLLNVGTWRRVATISSSTTSKPAGWTWKPCYWGRQENSRNWNCHVWERVPITNSNTVSTFYPKLPRFQSRRQ